MTLYPVEVQLSGRRTVVVGGGGAAHRHVAGLVAAGARVTLVAPALTPALESLVASGRVTRVPRRYATGDLDGAWFAVAATGDPAVDAVVARDAEAARIHCTWDETRPAPDLPSSGGVVLVGGGPGDPGLITVRGQQALDEADVVVVDHLAPQGLLPSLAPHVEVVDASKLPRGRAMAQERINELLVAHARAGRRVVRLKGGDPFVFGRGMEELEACTAAGVPVEVVPGVTSAVAVPALAGVPVTHRGLTHEFVVVSGHVPPGDPSSLVDWAALGRLRGTVVVLMGVDTAAAIAEALVRHGRPPGTSVAVVVDGASATQRVLRTTLAGLGATMAREAVRPPAVWVVGDVVDLAGPGSLAVGHRAAEAAVGNSC